MFTGEIKWSAKAHDFNGIGFRKSMIHKDLFIYCGSENIYAIELNSGYLRMALRYHYDHGDIIDKKIFLAGIRPNINDSCSILWGMDDRVYCLNPYYGTIYRTFYPGPNIKPSGLPDGYDGFGNVIDSGESEIVCYIYSLRKYDPRLFSVDIKNWTTLWKYEDYTLREAFIYNDDAFILKESEIIKSNARDGKEQWNIKLGRGHIVLSHAISDRIIYITEKWMENGNRSALFAVNIDTGEIIWRDILLGRIQSAPKIYGNKLYLIYSPNDPYDNISILRVYDHNGATATIYK